jgi:phosphate transport system permease protein
MTDTKRDEAGSDTLLEDFGRPGSLAAGGPRGRVSPWVQVAIIAGSLVVALLIALVAGHVVPGALVGFALMVIGTAVVLGVVEGARQAKNRVFTIVVTHAFLLALVPLVTVTILVISEGSKRFDLEFWTSDMRGVLGPGGGALHAIAGTLVITGTAALISVPIGILCAIYLVEYGRGRLAKAITIFVDVMTGIPSIVAGLFAYAFFAIFFGPSIRFGFGGAVALSVLMIPVVVRSVEEMLKLVPNELREASYALGVPRWRTIIKVVLPTAGAGMAAGITIAIARVIGETAPLLIIAGSTKVLNTFLFNGRMMTLPVFTYESYMIPGVPPEPGVERAWAAALTLMIIVMGLNLIARLIARVLGNKTR